MNELMEKKELGVVAGTQVPGKRAFLLLSNAHSLFLHSLMPADLLICIHTTSSHRAPYVPGTLFTVSCLSAFAHTVPNAWDAPFPILQMTNSYSLWRPSLRCHSSSDPALGKTEDSVLRPQRSQFLGLL